MASDWTDNRLGLLDVLRPQPSPVPLIRVGGNWDGAYLLPDDLKNIAACFSPGVSNTKRFEDELLDRYGIPSCLLYTSPSPRDATLSRMPSSA